MTTDLVIAAKLRNFLVAGFWPFERLVREHGTKRPCEPKAVYSWSTMDSMACRASIRPYPYSGSRPTGPKSLAVDSRMFRTSTFLVFLFFAQISAAPPEAKAVEALVPEKTV